MSDEQRFNRIKKAYADQVEKEGSFVSDGVFCISDLVHDGIDINNLSDLELAKGLEQEGFNSLQDMMYYSDFSEESWVNSLNSLLVAANIEDMNRAGNVSKQAAKSILKYLNDNGFVVENGLQ